MKGSKGLESEMKPAGNWTQIEFFDDAGENPYLKEYEGRGWYARVDTICFGVFVLIIFD